MKNLKDVLEKLKVDDIVLTKEFPINGTIKDVCRFLEENDFKFIENVDKISILFNSAKSKCYTTYNNRIWFTDTSKEKISIKNPIFTYMNNGYIKYYTIYYIKNSGDVEYIVENNRGWFRNGLNKHFGW